MIRLKKRLYLGHYVARTGSVRDEIELRASAMTMGVTGSASGPLMNPIREAVLRPGFPQTTEIPKWGHVTTWYL